MQEYMEKHGSGLVKPSDLGFMTQPTPPKNRAQRRQNVKGTPIRKSAGNRKIAR